MSAPVGNSPEVVVTGHAVHVPGASLRDLLGGPLAGEAADDVAIESGQAHLLLGRKGLLGKEPATRLALCAVHRALELPPGRPDLPLPGAGRTAVVVSSNLGNVATVCGIVSTVRAGSARDVSPLDVPNASSNVIASSIAIRYGFRGPALMVCNGETSGLDAIRLGARLLRSGRADRVVVAGVEPDDEVAGKLRATSRGQSASGPAPLRAAAACVVLSRSDVDNTEAVLGNIWSHGHVDLYREVEGAPGQGRTPVWFTPGDHNEQGPAGWQTVHLGTTVGDTYGALGVLQLALACSLLSTSPTIVMTSGDRAGGYLSAEVRRPRSVRPAA